MADDSNRIGSGNSSLLQQILGVGGTSPRAAGGSTSGAAERGAIGGPRGNRILPADYPLDQLDRRAARGTYLDILV